MFRLRSGLALCYRSSCRRQYPGNLRIIVQTMRLFSYKLTHDTGFAPNPFWGALTLATCKPDFRRSKRAGDWIAGFTSDKLCGDQVGRERLIFLMKIDQKVSIADYYREPRFQRKIPDMSAQKGTHKAGDNIYRPLCPYPTTASDFDLVCNRNHNEKQKVRDVSGKNVLIGTEFVYFGRNALSIPAHLRPDVPKGQSAQGTRTHDVARARKFIDFVIGKASACRIHGPPHSWPEGDESWRESR